MTKIVEQVEKMTVLEVADLVSAIEDKFGVSAAPVAVAGAAPAAGGEGGDGGEDEKSSYTVHLAAMGDKKIDVIKAVREVTDLGLGEAKDLVEGAPKDVKADVPKDEAEEAKKKLEAAGATVELK
ncbi:MAG: 50S ribosomal protein L7/L12 [bacterium]|nr:50S ribosomal protein L7/L12 [bacterium]MDZ4248119.1 50S ribosomal protein L7/L12 [Patescibacteria group bacterium]